MVSKRYTIVKMSEKMNKKCIAMLQLSTICLPEDWSIRLLQLNGMSHGNVPCRLPSLPSPLPGGVGGGSALAQSCAHCVRTLSRCETHKIVLLTSFIYQLHRLAKVEFFHVWQAVVDIRRITAKFALLLIILQLNTCLNTSSEVDEQITVGHIERSREL